ncbi:MAG TPA: asparagine synthase-related protein [Rhizomicrobium sp.]|jgi:asparagine synthase (glutamine-hydrolysing)|nr:asparagine synthase-related protein [Rhizomicrobium sp.]
MSRAQPAFDGARETVWTSPHAALVHKIFVITPEDRFERLPRAGHGGQSRFVFAGRLDNREELGAALRIDPPDLRTMADGTLCLAALERWSREAPPRLEGSFAFALWNETEHTLMLCRDKMGGRPLFYHRNEGFIAFATTFNGLFCLPQVPRAIDEVVLGDILALNTFEQRRTIYRDVLRVPSGCYAVCDAKGMRLETYWTPQRRPLGLKRHEDYVEAAREHLDNAVRPMLRSERPVAVQCSSGLDSPAVAATAARILAPARLAVIVRVPPAALRLPDSDLRCLHEGAGVRALAAMHPNMDVTEVDDDGLHAIDREPALRFALNGLPVFNPLNHGWLSGTVDAAVRGGHRVFLEGGWGNFSLTWGRNSSLHWHLLRGRPVRLLRELLALRRVSGQPLTDIFGHRVLRRLAPAWLQRWRRRQRGQGVGLEHGGFVDPQFLREHDLEERVRTLGGWQNGRVDADPFVARSKWLVRSNEIGRDWQGQTPAFLGLEKRTPLGDPRLIEFCLNVPEEHYLRGGWSRALARDVLADRAPPEIYANRKVGVQSPDWFTRLSLQRDLIQRDVQRIAASPLASRMIDMRRLRAAVDNWPATPEEAEARRAELAAGLTRAMQIGRFICWVEGGNAGPV